MDLKLEHLQDGVWQPLPDWASFLWSVGELIGGWSQADRLVVAVSAPTRSFAATLAAAGFLAVRSGLDQFREASQVPVGKDVIVDIEGKGFYRARVLGSGSGERGYPCIKLQLSASDKWWLRHRPGVRLYPSKKAFNPERKQPERISKVPGINDFCRAVIQGDADTYLQSSRPDCLMLGPVGAINSELTEQELRTTPQADVAIKGLLADVLRPQGMAGVGGSWHVRLVGLAGRPGADNEVPSLVVFDGTSAFRKWRTSFAGSDWLIVLDRSRSDFADGAALLAEEYRERKSERSTEAPMPPPVGIEYLVFTRIGRAR